MAKNFDEITNKFVDQVKSSAEGFGDLTGKTAKEVRESLERQGIKPVSLHLRNGERIDALMTPKQRKELDKLIRRGKGGLVSVKEAVFVGDRKKLSDAAEDLRVSANEVIAVGVRTLKDESDAFFARIGEGKTAREKFDKMREAMHQPIGQASREKASGVNKQEPFRTTPTQPKSSGSAPQKQTTRARKGTGTGRNAASTKPTTTKKATTKATKRKPRTAQGTSTKSATSKSTSARKPAAKKAAARKPAAKKAGGTGARKPTAKKPAARKPAARKPAARKPAAKKAGGTGARKPTQRKPAN